MNRRLHTALSLSSIAALALATAACGPDDKPATDSAPSSGFSLFNPIGPGEWPGGLPESVPEFSEADYFAGALPPLPDAVPMARPRAQRVSYGYDGPDDYRYAPDYYGDYAADEPVYYDDDPADGSYAWLALASALGGVLGDAPPDYYFDYDGVEPWVWETGDHFVRYAEPLDNGYRYYYYSPGRSYPFLVRDPYYSYGYYGDRVAVIYDSDGRVLDSRRAWRQRQAAQRYYGRARDLHEASRLRPRRAVAAPLWAERSGYIAREQRQWDSARVQRAGWQNWDRRNERAVTPRWTRERVARQYAARRFEDWRGQDYRGPAPRFYAEAERSPRLRQVVQQQRAERRAAIERRREVPRSAVRNESARPAALWSGRQQSEQRAESRASRDEAHVERLRLREQRLTAQRGREEMTEQRRAPAFREAQVARQQSGAERRVRADQRVSARGDDRAAIVQARRQERAERQSRSVRPQRELRAPERVNGRSEMRRQGRADRAQGQSQAQFQARQEARAQRSQMRQESRARQQASMQSQVRSEARMQRDQLRSQVRQEDRQQARMQQRMSMQSPIRQEARVQRQQMRQDSRAQRQQPERSSGFDNRGGGGRESRTAQREPGGGNDRRMH